MRVFKFSPLKGEKHQHVLGLVSKGECYFAPPAKLNDPFEYMARPKYDHQPFEVRLAFWMKFALYALELRRLAPDEQARWIERMEVQAPMIPDVLYQNGTQGIFCTCATWDNRVLWSHYADNQQGVAVEIETVGVELLDNTLTPVSYQKTPPELDFYGGCSAQDLTRVCATKHADWGYEKEVRFFCSSGIHRIPTTNIVGLLFGAGCRAAYPVESAALIDALQTANPTAQPWEISCDRRTGKLKRFPVE